MWWLALLFVTASAFDLFWTAGLFQAAGGDIEQNFVARAMWQQFGVAGLVGYKAMGIALILGVCGVIAKMKRPEIARRLLVFATLATGGVAVYGGSLYLTYGAEMNYARQAHTLNAALVRTANATPVASAEPAAAEAGVHTIAMSTPGPRPITAWKPPAWNPRPVNPGYTPNRAGIPGS